MESILDDLIHLNIQEPLTNRIRAILDEYPDGTQIARELLQNSDDAGSIVQWFLLDHRYHARDAASIADPTSDTEPLQLLHNDFHKFMGPSLLAGNNTVFSEEDFVSLQNLASSGKLTDESKIGQMGIGFNSIYHLTDCPSFITGDQFMVIDPHLNMFKTHAVRGDLVDLGRVPDLLKTFSVLEHIDSTKRYQGTIFRFPLRTEKQVLLSKISENVYTPAKVLEILGMLKGEALKALLFLKHVEKIIIYERKEGQDEANKLFEIEIENVKDVKQDRLELLKDLKKFVGLNHSASQEHALKYYLRPTYKITEDKSIRRETWHITTLVGNIAEAREHIRAHTKSNLRNHKLIPWVGIAAPVDPSVNIGAFRLFCFLPMGIQLPFPVHINGHFAVKQSRREIWTNQDNDFSSQAAAKIKSLWNVHLFEKHIPEVYAMFLENVGLDRGRNYDLWPTSCGEGIGLDAIWKDLLKNVLQSVIIQDRKVFFCGSKTKGDYSLRQYSTLYIAGRDIDRYALLKEALHSMVDLAEGIPDVILEEIGALVTEPGHREAILTPALVKMILIENKAQLTDDPATRVEMLRYCLGDGSIDILEDLPLLPLNGDHWVEFSQSKAQKRFLVSRTAFEALSPVSAVLVDLDIRDYPFDLLNAPHNKIKFWSPMPTCAIVEQIKGAFSISQSHERFPSDEWIVKFWAMAQELEDCERLLSGLDGINLLPVGQGQLAPLSSKKRVIHLDGSALGNVAVMQNTCSFLERHLGCNVLSSWLRPSASLQPFVVDISDALRILDLLTTKDHLFLGISQVDRGHLAIYMAKFLEPRAKITKKQKRILRRLPIYRPYNTLDLEPLDTSPTTGPTATTKPQRLAQGYSHTENPWTPRSIDLFAADQPMREHLLAMLSVSVLSESEYWYQLVSNLTKQDESEWDAIMTKLAPSFHVHNKIFDLASILRRFPFVLTQTPSGTQPEDSTPSPACRLSPESMFHPSLAAYFPDKASVFPAGIYSQPPLFGLLSQLGMHSTFDSTFAKERLKTLFGSGGLPMEENRAMVETLYRRLNSECSEIFLTSGLLYVLTRMPWVYTGSGGGWRTPANCRPQRDRALVGDKMALAEFEFTNDALLGCMGWKGTPSLKMVLDNFISIIDEHSHQHSADADSVTGSTPTKKEGENSNIDGSDIWPIYQYLSDKIKDPSALKDVKKRLGGKPWVLVSGVFYTVDQVALTMHSDLLPHFVQLQSSNLNNFFLALGVRKHVRQEDIEGRLRKMKSRYPEEGSLSSVDVDLVYRLLTAIAYGQSPKWSGDLLLLTKKGSLERAENVFYDDVKVRQSDLGTGDLPYTFTHNMISLDMAKRLGVKLLSARFWDEAKDNSFDPFFQQENIVDRIKGILNDYDPSSIFNEFLQNASDAGATECHFQLDTRSFGTEKVLSEQMAAWQGPALMIYNDAEFSDEDFEALCKLGIGNKKDDPSKIGRHGLGFNSVYHFTDVPSIVSGPYLGFFDPQMTNLHKSRDRNGTLVAKSGHRCDFRKLSMETFGDQLEPYKGFSECDMRSNFKGTLFRIPLRIRSTESPASKAGVTVGSTAAAVAGSGFGGAEWTVGQIQKMMEKWVADAKVGMLFLKNVKIIRISDGFKPEVMIKKQLLEPLKAPSPPSPLSSVFKIDVSPDVSNPSENVATSQWLVCCDDAFPSDTSWPVRHLADRRHWSPHRGVAIKIQDTDESKFHSKLFVHLPTPIFTDLPFHIHGDFALTSSRKSLAGGKEEEDEKRVWNSFLMETCLPQTAIRAMENLFTMHFPDPSSPGRNRDGFSSATAAYFKHWPFRSTVEFQPFLKAFLCQTYFSLAFPCPGATAMFPMQLKAGCDAILPGLVTIPLELEVKVVPWLSKGNRAVCIVPDPVMSVIKAEWSKEPTFLCKQVDGDFIRKSLRETPNYIKNNMETRAEREWILGLAFQPVLNPKVRVSVTSNDLQIIPLLNGEWMRLRGGKKKYYVPSQHERGLLVAKDILVDRDVFSTDELNLALDLLIEGDKHNVGSLPAEIFAETFLKENPGGVTDQQWMKLWDYLEAEYKCKALDAFHDFPILKTFCGTMTTLGKAKTGFQISGLPSQFLVFMDLLQDLDIVVYSPETHRSHKFFKGCPAYSELRLLGAIVTHWNDLSTYRAFSMTEAKGMRELVLACSGRIEQSLMSSVGRLPIWTTLGSTDTSPLIAACEAYFLEGHFDLDKFGAFSDVLCSVDTRIFKPMGAVPLKVAVALTDLVLPRFHSGALKCDGDIRTAYLDLLKNLFNVCKPHGKLTKIARDVISTAQWYVARDGSFHFPGELFVPGETLTEMLFADQPNVFADQEMVLLMARHSVKSNLRSLNSNPDLVVLCANKVLDETGDVTADQTTTRTRVIQLIQYLYKNPDAGGEDWMDAKWKFVPREVNLEWPYDLWAPKLPLYMAFSELVGFSTREVVWTQRGFFPAELQPSHAFKVRFPGVSTTIPELPDVLKHLNVLVRDIAPTWKSTRNQLRLKAILLNIYGTINKDIVGSSIEHQEWAVQCATELLECPYILNGNDKNSSCRSSWLWPTQLMFGIVDDVPPHYAADPVLYHYQDFLLALGAEQIQPVKGSVDVAVGRARGHMEDQMLRCFETQDQEAGFMDVRFKFQKGPDIQAHKFVLATASEFFSLKFRSDREFGSSWICEMGVQSICLSSYGDIRAEFWGLLHYFYSDSLTPFNGPPLFDNEDDQESMDDGKSDGDNSSQDEDGSLADDDGDVDIEILEPEYRLSGRLHYLLKLQHVAHQFEATRLKDLIAKELVEGQKVVHNNVFTIRDHAERNKAENVRDHCDKFIEANRASVMRHVQSEIRIRIVEDKLKALDGQGKGKAVEDTKDDKLEFSEPWSDNYSDGGSDDSFDEGVYWDATEDSWED